MNQNQKRAKRWQIFDFDYAYSFRSTLDESSKQIIREKDSASKRYKGPVDAPYPPSDEEASLQASFDQHRSLMPATCENLPVIQDDCIGILHTACCDITDDQLQQAARYDLRNGRLILKDRTQASKKAAGLKVLVEFTPIPLTQTWILAKFL